MSPDLTGRAGDIFFDLLGVEEAARPGAIDAACGGDAALRAQVQMLLSNHFRAQRFMETGPVRTGLLGQTPILPPGTRLAGYTVLGVLGSGGMGVVYVAEQHKPRRTVALKVIKSGGGSLARRFELEAEVLGRLQHPGIAHIFEAGAADLDPQSPPLPFIAMELISGLPLTQAASARALTVRERVDLMRRVCEAVEHAHQRGVIHRDLKPGNILVSDESRAPSAEPDNSAPGTRHAALTPKILDFGVARAIGDEAKGVTAHTDIGQLIGTLAYMSPEQVRAHPAEVDTRSDVYALGVILFELLTGRTPHELKDLPLPEAARVICDTPAPRLSTIDRSLRGDLETITAKALDKDKERRYRSAADLADDLRRYLEGQPISARDDSALYILRKQIRRYRGTLAVGAVSVLALAATAVYALEQSARNARLAQSESTAKTRAIAALNQATAAQELADQSAARLRTELTVSNIERGRLFGRTANLAAAEDLLWPEFLRDPESRRTHWALWDLYSRQTCLGTIQAHTGALYGMALGADGALYTGGADGAVRAFDSATMRPIATFDGHTATVYCVSLSPDGRRLVSASADGTIRVWTLGSASPPLVIVNPPSEPAPKGEAQVVPVRAAVFSPDGHRIATGGDDRAVRVWDAQTGAPLATLKERFRTPVARVVWSPQGAVLAASAMWPDGTVRIWDGVEGSPSEQVPGHDPAVSSMAFSPDGLTLATGGSDREIHLVDLATRQTRHKLLAPNGTVRCLQYTADGRTLMSMGWWTLDLWNPDSGERRRSLSLREGANAGVMRADGAMVAAGFADGTIQIWDLHADAGLIRLRGQSGRTTAALTPDAKVLVTGDSAGRLRFWDSRTGALLATVAAHSARIRALKFTPDGRLLATCADDGRVRLLDLTTGKPLAQFQGVESVTCDSIALSPAGDTLAAPVEDGSVALLALPDLRETRRIHPAARQVVSVCFSPDSTTLAAASRDLKLHLSPARADDHAQDQALTCPGPPWTVAFAPSGSRMAVGSWDKTVELWDTGKQSVIESLRGHSALVSAVAFFPGDPDVVVSSATDGTVRLWDATSGLALATLDAFGGWDALSVSISSDGRRVASASANGEAVIWDMTYFDRHIAGNAEHHLVHLLPSLGPSAKPEQVRAWAHNVLAHVHDAWLPPEAPGVEPDVIRAWGAPVTQQ